MLISYCLIIFIFKKWRLRVGRMVLWVKVLPRPSKGSKFLGHPRVQSLIPRTHSHKGDRRELIPQGCHVTSTCTPWCLHRHTDRLRYRQTDTQTNTQTHRYTQRDRQTHTETNTQTDIHRDRHIYTNTHVHVHSYTCIYKYIHIHTIILTAIYITF